MPRAEDRGRRGAEEGASFRPSEASPGCEAADGPGVHSEVRAGPPALSAPVTGREGQAAGEVLRPVGNLVPGLEEPGLPACFPGSLGSHPSTRSHSSPPGAAQGTDSLKSDEAGLGGLLASSRGRGGQSSEVLPEAAVVSRLCPLGWGPGRCAWPSSIGCTTGLFRASIGWSPGRSLWGDRARSGRELPEPGEGTARSGSKNRLRGPRRVHPVWQGSPFCLSVCLTVCVCVWGPREGPEKAHSRLARLLCVCSPPPPRGPVARQALPASGTLSPRPAPPRPRRVHPGWHSSEPVGSDH